MKKNENKYVSINLDICDACRLMEVLDSAIKEINEDDNSINEYFTSTYRKSILKYYLQDLKKDVLEQMKVTKYPYKNTLPKSH